jgi:hypothetical protein
VKARLVSLTVLVVLLLPVVAGLGKFFPPMSRLTGFVDGHE